MAAQPSGLRLYAVLDGTSCAGRNLDLIQVAEALYRGGIRLFQYRDKAASEADYLGNARALQKLLVPNAFLLLNDHVHLVSAAGADGVHIGQTDCSVHKARSLVGPDAILGVSTHSVDQASIADHRDIDYIAVGPVFTTSTKFDAEPVIGLCGVQAARAVTQRPLVAIGGIRMDTAQRVKRAGADSIAVISALLPSSDLVAIRQTAQDFLARLK